MNVRKVENYYKKTSYIIWKLWPCMFLAPLQLGIQFSDCPKYFPEIVASIFNITTSSSSSAFPARMFAHFRSRLLSAAQVSASSGASTIAQRAKSHMQSFLVMVFAGSSKLIRFNNIDTRATESIPKTAERRGGVGQLLLVWSMEVFNPGFSTDSMLSTFSAVELVGWSIGLPMLKWLWTRTCIFVTLADSPKLFPLPGSFEEWTDCRLPEHEALEPSRHDRFWSYKMGNSEKPGSVL